MRLRVEEQAGAHTENRLDVSAYRCVDVAGRNRQNCAASNFPVTTGCHPVCATSQRYQLTLVLRKRSAQ